MIHLEEYYPNVITTRTFDDRLDTIQQVQNAGINLCCGGILGLGESREDRFSFIKTLAELDPQPASVPINVLAPIPGTPMYEIAEKNPIDKFELVRTIATVRVLIPQAQIRLSAGRLEMSDELQAMCFIAGANSIFTGEKLLTTENPDADRDRNLVNKLGMSIRYE